MAICDTTDCRRDRKAGIKFCNLHDPTNKANIKAKAASDRAASEKAVQDKIATDRLQAIKLKTARLAARAESDRVERIKVSNQAAASMVVILNLVDIVRSLRLANPGRHINAGKNDGLADTVGGTDTAYTIVSLAKSAAAKPSDIRTHLLQTGKLENSDSGYLKYRSNDDIFIHVL